VWFPGGDAGTGTNCKIDSNDPKTNSIGFATVTLTHANVQEIDTVYAWLGSTGHPSRTRKIDHGEVDQLPESHHRTDGEVVPLEREARKPGLAGGSGGGR
jgi:hypothetical protein